MQRTLFSVFERSVQTPFTNIYIEQQEAANKCEEKSCKCSHGNRIKVQSQKIICALREKDYCKFTTVITRYTVHVYSHDRDLRLAKTKLADRSGSGQQAITVPFALELLSHVLMFLFIMM